MWVVLFFQNIHYLNSWKFSQENLVNDLKDKIEKEYNIKRYEYDLYIEYNNYSNLKKLLDDHLLNEYCHDTDNIIIVSPKPIYKIISAKIKNFFNHRKGIIRL